MIGWTGSLGSPDDTLLVDGSADTLIDGSADDADVAEALSSASYQFTPMVVDVAMTCVLKVPVTVLTSTHDGLKFHSNILGLLCAAYRGCWLFGSGSTPVSGRLPGFQQ